MLFSSFAFLFLFLPVSLAGFALSVRRGARTGAVWLAVASLCFYAWWRFSFLPLLLISIAFNFSIGRLIAATYRRRTLQSALLFLGIGGNLLALVYFKYIGAIFAFLLNQGIISTQLSEIILPLGISFFTFTQIAYLVDVREGLAEDRGLLSYLLFVTFFPHLIAGPILHHRDIMPQFADPRTYRLSSENLMVGMTVFVIGLTKKTLFADPFSADVAAGFGSAHAAGFTNAWHAVIAYSLQLYFDFSGYSDMAIGLARMFNVKFPLNFDSPYKSGNIADFWRRWHITLGAFLRDYLYIPLGGNRRHVNLNLMITMGLAGIWHGAGLTFALWGILHGGMLVVHRLYSRVFRPMPKPLATSLTLLCVVIAWVPFRAASINDAMAMLAGMAGLHGAGEALPLATVAQLVVLSLIVMAAPNTQQIMNRYEPTLGKMPSNPFPWTNWRPNWVWATLGGLAAGLGILAMGGTTEFLYFQF